MNDDFSDLTTTKSIASQINSNKKSITILFTDIKDSTMFWDKVGDVQGRLMIDQHNRLLFPVVKKYNGKIIKTIGDAIMASFKKPAYAVRAAIAMQQILEKERSRDNKFDLEIRIGIHTGEAIVEQNDVYGDVVNIASRVESQGDGSEILISNDTGLQIKKGEFSFKKKCSFTPKGKKKAMSVYSCNWQSHKNLSDNIKTKDFLPVVPKQKRDLLLYLILSVSLVIFLFVEYVRYLLVDSEQLALLFLAPQNIIYDHAIVFTIAVVLVLIALGFLLFRVRHVPLFSLKLLKGGFGAGIAFFMVYLLTNYFPTENLPYNLNEKLKQEVYQSQHLFVEVLQNKVPIRFSPSLRAKIIKKVDKYNLLLLIDVKERNRITWNKVLVKNKLYGWVPRVIPPKIGVPEQRMTLAYKFYLKNKDLVALLLGVFGFIWGFFSFRIRPA